MIKYIGSKRLLVPTITAIAEALPDVQTACDLFTGTTRVAQGLKRCGLTVTTNDLASYSLALGRTYIEADARSIDHDRLRALLAELEAQPDIDGWFTESFCRRSRYFQPHNGMRIDAIRPAIDRLAADEVEHAILLTSLLEAADRVDSTTGLQMAYLKQWAPRSHNRLELRLPELLEGGGGRALQRDANELACDLDDIDLVYLDPPYNQHKYFSNYHVWESVVRNDEPELYGIACKRIDCRERTSDYNSARRAAAAFADLAAGVRAPWLLVSFNAEGYLDRDDIVEVLAARGGHVGVLPVGHKRYVGAQIGIHNLRGEKVGTAGHTHTTEYLFLVGDDHAAVDAALDAGRAVQELPKPVRQRAQVRRSVIT